jgi:predicted nucleotidyltransferase
MYLFKDKYNLGKPYIYIHPYKQMIVRNVVEKVFSDITQLIVFGSSVSLTCKPYSDVDICVIGNFDGIRLGELRVKGEAIDFVHYPCINELQKDKRLFNEIKKGVRIYG